jgi:Domain of unknown function (DUF4383)
MFNVSVPHNLAHLAFGVAGLALARMFTAARGYLMVGGAVYLVLFVYGPVIDRESAMNFVRSTTPTIGCTSGWRLP